MPRAHAARYEFVLNTQWGPMSDPSADRARAAMRQGGIVAGNLLKGFRDFILRGNIVDLAVGVVIGVAFNDLVTRFTGDFIKPLVSLVGGDKAFAGSFNFRHQTFAWADFINAIINFVIVAAVIYFFVVKPMNAVMVRMKRGEETAPPSPPTDETVVLREIRDILKTSPGATAGAGAPEPRSGASDSPAAEPA
jgi:large conductance mechanosensitive channel